MRINLVNVLLILVIVVGLSYLLMKRRSRRD